MAILNSSIYYKSDSSSVSLDVNYLFFDSRFLMYLYLESEIVKRFFYLLLADLISATGLALKNS